MITKSDLDAAVHKRREERRREVIPPTFDEVDALMRGDLNEEDADEIRERLSYYPELAHVMTTPFPAKDDGQLSDADVQADIAKIRERVGEEAVVVPMRGIGIWLPIAASFLIALSIAGYVWTQRARQASRPVVQKVLFADTATRGESFGPPAVLFPNTRYLLKPLYRPESGQAEARFVLYVLSADGSRDEVWNRSGIRRAADGSYPIEVFTDKYDVGDYELALFGSDEATPLAKYSLRIQEP